MWQKTISVITILFSKHSSFLTCDLSPGAVLVVTDEVHLAANQRKHGPVWLNVPLGLHHPQGNVLEAGPVTHVVHQ